MGDMKDLCTTHYLSRRDSSAHDVTSIPTMSRIYERRLCLLGLRHTAGLGAE